MYTSTALTVFPSGPGAPVGPGGPRGPWGGGRLFSHKIMLKCFMGCVHLQEVLRLPADLDCRGSLVDPGTMNHIEVSTKFIHLAMVD